MSCSTSAGFVTGLGDGLTDGFGAYGLFVSWFPNFVQNSSEVMPVAAKALLQASVSAATFSLSAVFVSSLRRRMHVATSWYVSSLVDDFGDADGLTGASSLANLA